MMRQTLAAFLLVTVGACSATPEVSEADQAIEDYLVVGELEEVKQIRTRDRDSYTRLTDHYVVYDSRDGEYLLYFAHPCREMRDSTRVTPDVRSENRIRTGFDTLRGCRIDGMYALTDAQAAEIRDMNDRR
jgi:hypothetical protein